MSELVMEHHEQHHLEGGHGAYHDGSNQWMEGHNVYGTPQHQSPSQEFAGFHYPHMPMDPLYGGMPPPPRTTHQQLPQLITMPQWPSQLANQSQSATYTSSTYSSTPMSLPTSASTPLSTPLSAPPTAPARSAPTPRKTLTDQDRRHMCQYHEANPNVKQTDIGAMFGVERSTVSKVLRQKEKYLAQDDGSRSPPRKPKGKFPDIERALLSWIRIQQKKGMTLPDSAIREKARFFATSVGSPESNQKVNSIAWLEKFKAKHNIPGAKLRKRSLAGDSEASNPASGVQSPSGLSPTLSPKGTGSPTESIAISADKSLKGTERGPLGAANHGNRVAHSISNPVLPAVFDRLPGTFSPVPASPSSPFFTPDSATGTSPFVPIFPREPHVIQRPRSSTFPTLGTEPFSPPSSGSLTPKYLPAPSLESPLHEFSAGNTAMEGVAIEPSSTSTSVVPSLLTSPEQGGTMASPPLPTTIAPSSLPLSIPMSTRTHSSPITPSSISSPSSPSQEEARQALEIVMHFFQQQPHGFVEPQEFMTIGKLMEKLKLHSRHNSIDTGVLQQQHAQAQGLGLSRPSLSRSATDTNLGGLASIPESHM